ncbi:hypothetical protein DITRI_Ditri03aG0215800 [Diplodiscus trichospermus]
MTMERLNFFCYDMSIAYVNTADCSAMKDLLFNQILTSYCCLGEQKLEEENQGDAIAFSETPKLFTSTLKVPRLKASSPKT